MLQAKFHNNTDNYFRSKGLDVLFQLGRGFFVFVFLHLGGVSRLTFWKQMFIKLEKLILFKRIFFFRIIQEK